MPADQLRYIGCTVSALTSLVLNLEIGRAELVNNEPAAKRPFASIGPTEVNGPAGRYLPFYHHAIVPSSVVRQGIVYCSFQDTSGRPVVMALDIMAKTWSEPVYASRNGLGRDAHGNPSLCIDERGYLHVFYGCHRGPLLHARSVRPYDIREWQEQAPPTQHATYPQSVSFVDGTIFLLYRAGGHLDPWCARTSEDYGASWSEAEEVIDLKQDPPDPYAGAYATLCPSSDGQSVHIFFVHKDDNMPRANKGIKHPWRSLVHSGLHEAVYRYNMYYVNRSAKSGWYTSSGKPARVPISKAFADASCLAYDSGDDLTNIGAAFVDSMGRPYIRFAADVGDWKNSLQGAKGWSTSYAVFDQDRWRVATKVPSDWPEDAKLLALSDGTGAFGSQSIEPWFLSYEVERDGKMAKSVIFLYHPDHGYLGRQDGPAELP